MRSCQSFVVAALTACLAACGQAAQAPAADSATTAAASTNGAYANGQAPIILETLVPSTPLPQTWFICDALDSTSIWVASAPDANGVFALALYDKETHQVQRTPGLTLSRPAVAGPNGPMQAFGQNGADMGVIYTLDPARMSAPNAATTAPVISLDVAGEEFTCRHFEHTVFFGFTNRQSIVARQVGDSVELMFFSFSDTDAPFAVELEHGEQTTTASETVSGGRGSVDEENGRVSWVWENTQRDANEYRVFTAIDEESVLQTSVNGQIMDTEAFQAYALARR